MIDPLQVSPDLKSYNFHVSMILSGPSAVAAGASAIFTFHGVPPTGGGQLAEAIQFVSEQAEKSINKRFEKEEL